ncbi:MAG: metal-dependent hydrolase [Phycisphaeraceae bacterium]|nr:metal-dependent hydrolase [Phycisphaeraceae bacterium]
MDPLTQGLLGATLCGAVFSKQLGRWSWLVGFVAGIAADADVIAYLWMQPLDALYHHRFITHTFWFIPIGGFIVALPFMLMPKMRLRRKSLILAAIAGYATHAPLDMMTSYGTPFFWPLDMTRISLDIMPIVDPLFSLILFVGVILLIIKRSNTVGRLTLLIAGLYLAIAATQHNSAINAQLALIDHRNQDVQIARVMPTPGNIMVWNSIYKTKSEICTDIIRVTLSSEPVMIVEGKRHKLARQKQIFKKHKITDQHRISKDIANFRWFASELVAPIDPKKPAQLADMRYLALGQPDIPLWYLKVDYKNPDQPAKLVHNEIDTKAAIQSLWELIKAAPQNAKPVTDYYPVIEY